MKTIYSYEFKELEVVDQYFSLAHAYLNGSKVLCASILRDDSEATFPDTRVVLHLCRQAIELFLKGAICNITGENKEGHNLDILIAEYEQVLPDAQFHFDVPFGIETSGTQNSNIEAEEWVKRYPWTLDQRHRYPTDKNGNSFTGWESFIPLMYMSTLEGLSAAFLLVESHLESGVGGGSP